MRILTVIGARPQFVKASVLSKAFASSKGIDEIILHTGQHFDSKMSDVFFDELDIPFPKYNLNIHGLSHGTMTGRMLEGIEQIILKEDPDWILVYGDTNSTLAGALAGSKLNRKVAHVESGLRSYNMKMPEEINRILTDRLSSALFCPSQAANSNLTKEGYDLLNVDRIVVGDVMLDSALYFLNKARSESQVLNQINLSKFCLATIHRAENTDDSNKIKQIIDTLNLQHEDLPVVMPLHPRTKEKLIKYGIKTRFHIIDPVGYLDMLLLLDTCEFVITDSGGLQKEAYFFKKPCLTLRDQTEWVELIEAGVNKLVGCSSEDFFNSLASFRKSQPDFSTQLYGNGDASEKISKYFLEN